MRPYSASASHADPWAVWLQSVFSLYRDWSKLMLHAWDELLRNEQLLTLHGLTLSNVLSWKQGVDRVTEATLAQLQTATRVEFDRTLHRLNEIEGRLHDLDERLQQLYRRDIGGE